MAAGAQTKQVNPLDTFTQILDLPHDIAVATFQAAMQTRETSNAIVRNLTELGFSTQEAAFRLVKESVGSLYETQHDLMRKTSGLAEKMFVASSDR